MSMPMGAGCRGVQAHLSHPGTGIGGWAQCRGFASLLGCASENMYSRNKLEAAIVARIDKSLVTAFVLSLLDFVFLETLTW